MPKKPGGKRGASRKIKKTSIQLKLFPLKLYFLLLPIAAFLASYVLFTSVSKSQSDQVDQIACCVPDFSHDGNFVPGEKMAYFEGQEVSPPSDIPVFAGRPQQTASSVLGLQDGLEKWIEIDLSDQKIYAWEGATLFLESLVSSGKRWTPTPTGEYTIWYKTKAQKMSGGSKENGTYYYLPNVPYIMFFQNDQVPGHRGYSLHGTYWHNNFGNQMSHGCVNLPTPIAEQLYYWTNPTLEDGKNIIRATSDNPGTRIVIHE